MNKVKRELNLISTSIAYAAIILLFFACEKDVLQWNLPEKNFIEIETREISKLDINKIQIDGSIKNIDNTEILQVGHCWSNQNERPSLSLDTFSILPPKNEFTSNIEALAFSEIYYLRAYAVTDTDTLYGETRLFSIETLKLITEAFVKTSGRNLMVRGRFSSETNNYTLTDYGHCWSNTNAFPTVNDEKSSLGISNQQILQFSSDLKDLQGQFYYIRSYAIINGATIYGNIIEVELKNIWEQIANFPGSSRLFSVGFSIGAYGYVGTGGSGNAVLDPGNQTLFKDFWQYDSKENNWQKVEAEFPGVARGGAIAFTIQDTAYFGFGFDINGRGLNDFYSFHPNANPAWKILKNFPDSGRSAPTVTVIKDKAYMIGGEGSTQIFNDLWIYNPKLDKWEERESLPTLPFRNAISFSLDQKLFVGLGDNSTDEGTLSYQPNKEFWQYDLKDSTPYWEQLENLPSNFQDRAFARIFTIGPKAYIVGGAAENIRGINEIWEFDSTLPPDSQWLLLGETGAGPRALGATFIIENKGYYGLGINQQFSLVNDFWQFER